MTEEGNSFKFSLYTYDQSVDDFAEDPEDYKAIAMKKWASFDEALGVLRDYVNMKCGFCHKFFGNNCICCPLKPCDHYIDEIYTRLGEVMADVNRLTQAIYLAEEECE